MFYRKARSSGRPPWMLWIPVARKNERLSSVMNSIDPVPERRADFWNPGVLQLKYGPPQRNDDLYAKTFYQWVLPDSVHVTLKKSTVNSKMILEYSFPDRVEKYVTAKKQEQNKRLLENNPYTIDMY